MNSQHIELFINRLHAFFPTDPIPKNTIIETWRQDKYLLSVSHLFGTPALEILEKDGKFPSLPRVKSVFKQLQEVNNYTPTNTCRMGICDGNGYIQGEDVLHPTKPNQTVASWVSCECKRPSKTKEYV